VGTPGIAARAEDRGGGLRRALALLTALGSEQVVDAGGAGVSALAALTGQDKSQVSRTLRTLADAGMVDRDPETLLYRIGWQLFALASRAGDQQLVRRAAPLLTAMVGQIGERSHLSVLRGAGVLTVLTESPAHVLQTVSWVGRVVPWHGTSSGRALLLDSSREQLEALLGTGPLERHGPNSPADVDELVARIDAARSAGVVVADEEFEAGLVGVSAPVRDVTGRIVAALNVSGPTFRLSQHLDQACATVAACAARLSEQVGFPAGHASPSPSTLLPS
jgi:IclR family KDG regulon transcriptional repressor